LSSRRIRGAFAGAGDGISSGHTRSGSGTLRVPTPRVLIAAAAAANGSGASMLAALRQPARNGSMEGSSRANLSAAALLADRRRLIDCS
jgi:hypothetical protein